MKNINLSKSKYYPLNAGCSIFFLFTCIGFFVLSVITLYNDPQENYSALVTCFGFLGLMFIFINYYFECEWTMEIQQMDNILNKYYENIRYLHSIIKTQNDVLVELREKLNERKIKND